MAISTTGEMAREVTSGHAFGRALAKHLGLRYVLDVQVNCCRGEIFGATVRVELSPADLEAVGRLMAADAA